MSDDPANQSLTEPADGAFSHVRTWVFDLDNTLYPVTKELIAQIDKHMGSFVANFLNVDAEEARHIQKSYFRKYGLTLRGLMLHHGLDPVRYFDEMTPMDLTQVDPNPALADALDQLPGRKVIYTNASAHHAEMVLDRLGISDVFDGLYDIAAADYVPKPAIESYRILCDQHNIDPSQAAMIDDIARNLEPAAALGMTTVWMKTGAAWAQDTEPEPYVDHIIDDILPWVRRAGQSVA
jgi:putative hydrolase of the HAD superfamily